MLITLCLFHIEMAYFKALGKIISKSWGPFLLQECQVSLTSVTISVNDGMKILETLFEVVHFKTFLDSSKTKLEILEIVSNPHYVKSVQIRSNFWSVFSRIPTEYGEIRSISVFREVQVVIEFHSRRCFDIFSGNKMIPWLEKIIWYFW